MESKGRYWEVGGFLLEEDRKRLARSLKQLIGRIGESPDIAANLHAWNGPIEWAPRAMTWTFSERERETV